MRARGNGLTREQQIAHVDILLAALALDLRQAHANGDLTTVLELEIRSDELLDWKLRLDVPNQREGDG